MKCKNKTFSKVGNSTCIILSKTMLEQSNLKENDILTINCTKDLITIRKQKDEEK
jgi:antitoxin component of MazEF toxin-antitoxin module